VTETTSSPGVAWPKGTVEKLEGFRSTRASDRSGARPPTSRDPEFGMMGFEEKPARLRRQKKLAGYGTGVFSLGIVLGLAGILFYSQQMWGSLTALTDNIKELTGKHQSDAVTPPPMSSGEKSTTDRWEEKKASEAPAPELPPIDQQQTWKQPENPTTPEQPYEELLKHSAPVEQRRSSTVARKPLDSAPPTPDKRSFPPAPSSAASTRYGTVVTDRDLELQVEKAIDNRALRGIAVSVRDGTAYLRGRVPTPRQRLAATRAAQSVPGVKAIDNQVSLDSEPD
jgi:BON domain